MFIRPGVKTGKGRILAIGDRSENAGQRDCKTENQNHRVRNDANVRAQPDQLHRFKLGHARDLLRKLQRAEHWLIDDRRIARVKPRVDLPAVGSANAMRNGKIPSLLRVHVILGMRIAREKHGFAVRPRSLNALCDV